MSWIRLLSPLDFFSYAPAGYKDYVKSLYTPRKVKGRGAKAPKKEYSARLTAKGTLTITVRRKPKNLTHLEVGVIAELLSIDPLTVLQYMEKKKIILVENATKKELVK